MLDTSARPAQCRTGGLGTDHQQAARKAGPRKAGGQETVTPAMAAFTATLDRRTARRRRLSRKKALMGGSRARSVLVALSAAALCVVGVHPAAGAAASLLPAPGVQAGTAIAGALWVKRFNGPGNGDDGATSLGVSPDGSTLFVTGGSTGATSGFDYATVAYRASTGAMLWAKRYKGPGHRCPGSESRYDQATALVVSADQSTVFVTGASCGSGTNLDYATVAYDASTGAQRWAKRYNGPGNGVDYAEALGVSSDGSTVLVTGHSLGSTTGDDYATVAYDASTGAQRWAKRYNGPGNGVDYAEALGVSPDGSTVFVTGGSLGSTSGDDYATVAYDASTGAQRWAKRYNGPGNYADEAYGLGMSPDGSTVFVTGQSIGSDGGYDYATVSYDAPTGARVWVKRYNGTGKQDDYATALGMSPDGSAVFVTGYSIGTEYTFDYATVAYDASTGAKLWVKRYNGPGNDTDDANALAVSPDGSTVLVTGASLGSTGDADYATVAYDASTGAQLWVERYNGPGKSDDYAYDLAVSPRGSAVFVTGESVGSTGSLDYATVAYSVT
jgi:WD40 repeat protein